MTNRLASMTSAEARHAAAAGPVVLLAAAFTVNLGAAHYRDALAGGAWDGATTQALAHLLASPLGITDLKSWLLFVLAALAAAWLLFYRDVLKNGRNGAPAKLP